MVMLDGLTGVGQRLSVFGAWVASRRRTREQLTGAAREIIRTKGFHAVHTAEMAAMHARLGELYDSNTGSFGPMNRFTCGRPVAPSPATEEPVLPRQGGCPPVKSARVNRPLSPPWPSG